MDRVIMTLLDVIKGLLAIIDEQNLLIQKMVNNIRGEVEPTHFYEGVSTTRIYSQEVKDESN